MVSTSSTNTLELELVFQEIYCLYMVCINLLIYCLYVVCINLSIYCLYVVCINLPSS